MCCDGGKWCTGCINTKSTPTSNTTSPLMEYLNEFAEIDEDSRKPFITESKMFRHNLGKLEDARMRFWKVIQHVWDGKSIYDK